jgi:hypothetical protein
MQYDVFLSHNSADKPTVEALARRLTGAGIRPWLDKWNLIPGEPWQEAIEEALDACQTVAVFLGPNGIGPWENEEMRSAIDERVRDKSRRVIPVLLPGASVPQSQSLPRFLRRLTWVDFGRGVDDAETFQSLVAGIRGVAPGPGGGGVSVKPASAEAPVQVNYDTAAIRELLTAAFSDEELEAFCYDHFRPVADAFSAGMSRRQKIQSLIQYCVSHLKMPELLRRVQAVNPARYDEYKERLQSTST